VKDSVFVTLEEKAKSSLLSFAYSEEVLIRASPIVGIKVSNAVRDFT